MTTTDGPKTYDELWADPEYRRRARENNRRWERRETWKNIAWGVIFTICFLLILQWAVMS